MTITLCPDCGALLTVPGDETWLPCVPLPDAEAATPSGRRSMAAIGTVYRDSRGDEYSREAYQKKWGFDPEPVWVAIKEWQAKNDPKEPAIITGKDRLKKKF